MGFQQMSIIFEKVSISAILVGLSAILILLTLIQKNSNFLDVRSIISTHLKVFSNSPFQCFVIFVVPLLLAVAAAIKKVLSEDIINTLNIVLTIFISMFFTMLSILSTLNSKKLSKQQSADPTAKEKAERYNSLLEETFNSVMFECLLCILVLVILFMLLFFNDFSESWKISLISGAVYYLSILVVFNIFVIIKRIKVLFDQRSKD